MIVMAGQDKEVDNQVSKYRSPYNILALHDLSSNPFLVLIAIFFPNLIIENILHFYSSHLQLLENKA